MLRATITNEEKKLNHSQAYTNLLINTANSTSSLFLIRGILLIHTPHSSKNGNEAAEDKW